MDKDNRVALGDMDVADRRELAHNHPLLDRYADEVNARHNLPAHLINGLKNAGERSESTGHNSVSPRQASGVMQFVPKTAKAYGLDDPTDPMASIDAAGRYASDLQKQLKTSDRSLLAGAYNSGPSHPAYARGELPNYPETQAYAKRVGDYAITRDAEDAKTFKPVNIPLAGADTRAGQKVMPEDLQDNATIFDYLKDKARQPAISGDSLKNAGMGAVHALETAGNGIGGIAIKPVNLVSRMLSDKNIINPQLFSSDASDLRAAPYMNTTAGKVGNMAMGALADAMPFNAISKANLVRKAAEGLTAIPAIGKTLGAMFPTSAAGAIIGAAQPVHENEGFGQHMANANSGLLAGPLNSILSGVGTAAGKASGRAGELLGKGLDYVGLTKPSLGTGLTSTGKGAVQSAFDNGVHVYPQQITAPGTALSPEQHLKQHKSYTQAIIKNDLGLNTPDLNAALKTAKNQANTDYGKVYANEKIPIGHTIEEINALHSNPRDPSFDVNRRSSYAKQLIDDAATAVEGKPVLTGEELQARLSGYKTLKRKLEAAGNGPNNTPDEHAINTVTGIMDTLKNARDKVLSPEKQELLKATDIRYKKMHDIEKVLNTDASGLISPSKYGAMIKKEYPSDYTYGSNPNDVLNNRERIKLAQFGDTYMTEHPAQAAVPSALDNLLSHPILGPVAGAAIAHLSDPSDNPNHMGVVGSGLGLGALATMAASKGKQTSKRAYDSDMGKSAGALTSLFGPGNMANAAAQTNIANDATNRVDLTGMAAPDTKTD